MQPDGSIPDYLLPAPILIHRQQIAIMRGEVMTSTGLKVTKTFTINEAEVGEGLIQYELLVDGESAWVGMGDDRVDGLLKIIMHITDQEPEIPNN